MSETLDKQIADINSFKSPEESNQAKVAARLKASLLSRNEKWAKHKDGEVSISL